MTPDYKPPSLVVAFPRQNIHHFTFRNLGGYGPILDINIVGPEYADIGKNRHSREAMEPLFA